MVGGDMTDHKNSNSAVTPGVTVNFLLISVKDRDLTPYLDGSPLPWCCRYGLCREDMAEEQDASISRRGSEAINLVPW